MGVDCAIRGLAMPNIYTDACICLHELSLLTVLFIIPPTNYTPVASYGVLCWDPTSRLGLG